MSGLRSVPEKGEYVRFAQAFFGTELIYRVTEIDSSRVNIKHEPTGKTYSIPRDVARDMKMEVIPG